MMNPVMSHWGYHSKVAQTEWLKQQKCIVSQKVTAALDPFEGSEGESVS